MEELKAQVKNLLNEKNGYRLGKPWKYAKNSQGAVIPILRDGDRKRGYITFPEVKDKVTISDSGGINRLDMKSGATKPVFIRIGTIFKGIGTQTRSAEESVVVEPKSDAVINVKCVHASHGIRSGSKFDFGGYAPRKVTTQFFCGGNQRSVWNAVHDEIRVGSSERLLGASPSFGSDDLASFKRAVKQVDEKTKKVLEEVPVLENQVGMIILSLSGVESIEYYDSPESWKAQNKEVIENYVETLTSEASDLVSLNEAKIKDVVAAFIKKLDAAEVRRLNETTYSLSVDKIRGEFVVYGNEVIFLIAMKTDEKEDERPSYVERQVMPRYIFDREGRDHLIGSSGDDYLTGPRHGPKPDVKGYSVWSESGTRRNKIHKLLGNPPTYTGYSISDISERSGEPFSTVRDELKSMSSNGLVDSENIGKAKLYRLKKNEK